MNNYPSQKELRNFGLFIGITFLLFLGWLVPLINGHSFAKWTIYISLPFIIIGIIKPNLLFLTYKLWISLGNLLGWINSYIILGLIYIIILIPIAFVMRIVRYDPLRIREKNKLTYKEYRKNQHIDLTKIF